MIGNAVPVNLAFVIAEAIQEQLNTVESVKKAETENVYKRFVV
jgi:translation elongation factor EF-1beta